PAQRALADSIKSGPRGQFKMSGPFAIYLHSPDFGELAQKLGGHLRFKTIRAIQAGRAPKSAPKDEIAIYDFVKELYGKRRVSTGTFNRVKKILGDAGTVELVGILGYYAMVSMR